jgi:flagellum-specific peptidoglycan hydrolase FlgJ
MLTPEEQIALIKIAAASVACETATTFPAEISAAQCIFESGWLSRCPGNNCFGIKVDQHGSGEQYVLTHEYVDGTWEEMPLAFEAYASIADCFADHARLLISGKPYANAWQDFLNSRDLDQFVRDFGPIYASAPSYTQFILSEMHAASVTNALAAARGTAAV